MRRWLGTATFAFSAVLIAQPARATCVWSDLLGDEIRVAEVKRDTARVHFVDGPWRNKACPSAAPACRSKSFVVPGDVVVTGASVGGLTCSVYLGARGAETVGYLPTAALAPWPAARQAPGDWRGDWRGPERSLTIAAAAGGALEIDGDASWGMGDPWRRANGGVHIGEVHGVARPVGGVVAFTMGEDRTLPYDAGQQDDCRIRMIRRGPYLIARDSGVCGGVNVSFSGIYRRAGAATRR